MLQADAKAGSYNKVTVLGKNLKKRVGFFKGVGNHNSSQPPEKLLSANHRKMIRYKRQTFALSNFEIAILSVKKRKKCYKIYEKT